ncbi:hypothetical protein Hanom_Chr08g00742681 [Helianthus anomalus]
MNYNLYNKFCVVCGSSVYYVSDQRILIYSIPLFIYLLLLLFFLLLFIILYYSIWLLASLTLKLHLSRFLRALDRNSFFVMHHEFGKVLNCAPKKKHVIFV